jgi:hypothetical protein
MAERKHEDKSVEPPDARALQGMAEKKPGAYRAMVETDAETGEHTIVYQSDAGIEVGREPYQAPKAGKRDAADEDEAHATKGKK